MNADHFSFAFPAKIVFGPGKAASLPEELARFKKILVVTGSRFAKTADFASLTDRLGAFSVTAVTGVKPEPQLEDVDRIIKAGRESAAEAVVAIGGGSVIDAAKAAAAIVPCGGVCRDYFSGERAIERKGLFFAALPTTAGTGAEMTSNSVLTDAATMVKKSLRHPAMLADLALVDPLLTLSCPFNVTAASGLDAFVQAFESYAAPSASGVSRALSASAIRKIFTNLAKACVDPLDAEARAELAEGSMTAGMAFASTGLGAIHGLAHPIGSLLHAPHGRVCAILIGPVTAWNMPCCEKQYAEMAEILGVGQSARDFVRAAASLCDSLNVEKDFSSFGLKREHFPFIIANCRSASMKNNPRPMSDSDVAAILETLLRPGSGEN